MNSTRQPSKSPTTDNACPEAARLSARVAELENVCRACDLAFWFLSQSQFGSRHEVRRAVEAMRPALRLLRPFDPLVSYSLTHGMSPLPDPAFDALLAIATLEPEEGETAAIRAHRLQQIALDAATKITGMELGGSLGIKAVVQNDWLQAKIDADDEVVDMWDRFDDIFCLPGTRCASASDLPEPLPAIESEAHNG